MQSIVNETKINSILAEVVAEDPIKVREVLAKALELNGLNLKDVACLAAVKDQGLCQEIFAAARKVKEKIYGKRIVIFAPLYVSNFCDNECLYCAFRSSNNVLQRHFLDKDQLTKETNFLINQGHKRVLLVSGEAYPNNDFQYILDAIKNIYEVKSKRGEIRRINVNLAPLDTDDFKRLKEVEIGTYQLFQETYHRDTYRRVHVAGKKADYEWRLAVFDRALQAGIDDIGLGVLLGLYDWRFEILALLSHANYLQKHFGVGPHTISVPRIEPALGSSVASNPFARVCDVDFCKLVAILRLAIPYTGIILSTRENLSIRREALALGVSQISAGSRSDPGGYDALGLTNASQFSLGDHRSLDEVVGDLASLGYIPSFCTACYRLGRTGEDFMCLTKQGKIKKKCRPNALVTFSEYLRDHASPETKKAGDELIRNELALVEGKERKLIEEMLAKLESGQKDIFC